MSSRSRRTEEAPVFEEPTSRWAAAARAVEGEGSTGYNNWQTIDDEREDYDNSEWLERKTKAVQNDSVLSTRRAVQRLQESELLAASNLEILALQSEQLHKAEGGLETAQVHTKVSDAKADHLKSLNRFFMLPSFGSKKAKKREAAAKREAAERAAREEERKLSEKEHHMRQQRMQQAQQSDFSSSVGGIYTTPEGIERDENEEEIDRNLDHLSSGLAKLKMMGQVMNTELESQNSQIGRLMDQSSTASDQLGKTTRKVQQMLK